MNIFVTKAYDLRQFLTFIRDIQCATNISHHLQYLEFLYKVKQIHNPQKTTLSLTNKTIIVEYFVVIEAILDTLLRQVDATAADGTPVRIEVNEYTQAAELLRLAKYYKIIDATVHSQLGQIKDTRNRIHIKRHRQNRKYEHEEYSPSVLKEREMIFKTFMEYLLGRNLPSKADKFPWPWNARP